MIDYAFIGARLKEARIRKNMTQEQLAAMTDVGSTANRFSVQKQAMLSASAGQASECHM